MASLTFQRAGWLFQVSRTSRLLSVSFSVPLSRRARQPELPSPSAAFRSPNFQRHPIHHHARRAFSSASSRRQASTSEATATTERTVRSSLHCIDVTNVPYQTPSTPSGAPLDDLSSGFNDTPSALPAGQAEHVDWSRSFHGLSSGAFSKETAAALLMPLDPADVEVKPDGIIYLPEIKYRRILNRAFGPGAWGLAPRGETIVTPKAVTREYALVALGRYASHFLSGWSLVQG